MTTWTAITTLPERELAQSLALAMERLDPEPMGIACLEIEDGSGCFEVAGYFKEKPDDVALILLATSHGVADFVISKLDETDWVAQVRRELTPVRAGRFFVHGAHDRDRLWASDIPLEIEAAMAFGTGHHGTTLGCLQLTELLVRRGFCPQRIADIGTGTGILAMAAARRFPDAQIVASDIESISVRTARANCDVNSAKRVRIVQAVGFHHPLHNQHGSYDLVYANILARPLRALARDMARYTTPSGHIILSGILRRQGAGVLSTYAGFGFKRVEQREIGEWVSYLLRRDETQRFGP